MSREHTVVIGAGIIGLSTAYHLARRGHRVTVLEQGSIDTGCSTGSAGIVALGHPPINRPGMIGKTLKWMLDKASPLHVAPRPSLSLLRWMWAFRQSCTTDHFEASMDVFARLGHEAGDAFRSIVEDELIDCEYRPNGWYDVFTTEATREHGRRDADLLREHGFEVDEYDGDGLRDREPAFNDAPIGAIHYAESAIANPRQFVVGLGEAARAHGATIRENAQVVKILFDGGRFTGVRMVAGNTIEADTLVLAAGVWSTPMARAIGLRLPMEAGKGYHVKISPVPDGLSTAAVLSERHIAVTPMEGAFRLAGTVEMSGINHDLIQPRIDALVKGARECIRDLGPSQVKTKWCGLRPCTPDGLPVMGWAPDRDGVYVNTGHAKMGLTLGPLSGRLAAETILDGAPSIDIEMLTPARFEGRVAAASS